MNYMILYVIYCNRKVGVFMHTLLVVLLVIVSITMIVSIMLQPSKAQGIGFMMGGSDTFFTKNKARTYESKMEKLTIVTAVIFAALVIAVSFIK